jgi:hypothetical protein
LDQLLKTLMRLSLKGFLVVLMKRKAAKPCCKRKERATDWDSEKRWAERCSNWLQRMCPTPSYALRIRLICLSTAHLTLGGDISHFHPEANGAALGETSHTDFRLLAELVRRMNGGGVYLNVGSAVVLPEIF